MAKYLVYFICMGIMASCSTTCSGKKDAGGDEYFEYANPLFFSSIDSGHMFRDPCIVKQGDTYYLTGTRYPHFDDHATVYGTVMYASEDLCNWRYVCSPVVKPDPDGRQWWKYYFWAPELFIDNGKYYYTVNCSRNGPGRQFQEVALFVADRIEGPYQPVTKDAPLIVGNDAHIFRDTDGKTYMFISGIHGFEVDLENGMVIGEVFDCVTPTPEPGKWTSAGATGMEGPYVVLRDGTYYLFFSTWARGYEIGYATAKNIRGPWKMCPEPIYGSMNPAACERNGIPYDQDYYANGFVESGHNTVFPGPDGRDWIVAHVFPEPFNGPYLNNKLHMAWDPIEFKDGKICVKYNGKNIKGPSQGPVKIKIKR